jgi:hypothetical protein
LADRLEDLDVVAVLIDLKARAYHAPRSVADRRMRANAHTEAALAVDESRYVIRSQSLGPSLLIVRTGRIVTAHAVILERGCDMNEYRRILGVPSI